MPAGPFRYWIAALQVEPRLKLPGTPPSEYERGYARLYIDYVMQAHQGADLDFLVGKSGAKVARESH